jgi:hypothetical protein
MPCDESCHFAFDLCQALATQVHFTTACAPALRLPGEELQNQDQNQNQNQNQDQNQDQTSDSDSESVSVSDIKIVLCSALERFAWVLGHRKMDLKCPRIAVPERYALPRKLRWLHLSFAKLWQRRSILRPPALRRCA